MELRLNSNLARALRRGASLKTMKIYHTVKTIQEKKKRLPGSDFFEASPKTQLVESVVGQRKQNLIYQFIIFEGIMNHHSPACLNEP